VRLVPVLGFNEFSPLATQMTYLGSVFSPRVPARALPLERSLVGEEMARPERFELPTFWFVAKFGRLQEAKPNN